MCILSYHNLLSIKISQKDRCAMPYIFARCSEDTSHRRGGAVAMKSRCGGDRKTGAGVT
jgi:hypothetical protein